MTKYQVLENDISGDSIRNYKERYALDQENITSIRCQHGKYDPELQQDISARLAVGKTEKVKEKGRKIGTVLHIKNRDIPSLAQALSDSGFIKEIETFYERTNGLEGYERGAKPGEVKRLQKDSPMDKAYQEFFQKKDRPFWALCFAYLAHIFQEERKVYSFFVSY